MNFKNIIKDVEDLNRIEYVKINGTEKERVIFKDKRTFKIFSDSTNEHSLNPFDDYSYIWLNSFLSNFLDSFKDGDDFAQYFKDFEESLNEIINDEVDIYNNNLLNWLSDGLNNFWYMDEVIKESGLNSESYDFVKHLQQAQYKAIEQYFYNYLESLRNYLNSEHNLNL